MVFSKFHLLLFAMLMMVLVVECVCADENVGAFVLSDASDSSGLPDAPVVSGGCPVKINCSLVVRNCSDNRVLPFNVSHPITVSCNDRLYIVEHRKPVRQKKNINVVAGYFKPSGGRSAGMPYRWYWRRYVNYCPRCGYHNCLRLNPKGVPEGELTCGHCDADFDGVSGYEKIRGSNWHLVAA